MTTNYPVIWLGTSWDKGYSPVVSVCLPPDAKNGDEVVGELERYPGTLPEAASQPKKFAAFAKRWEKYAAQNGYAFEFNDAVYERGKGGKFQVVAEG